jgi:hypothetical protein
MEPRRPGKAELLLAVASTLAMTWASLPPHQRQLATMRAAAWAQRASARLARLQGQAGMSDELAGRAQAWQYYAAAYRLSRVRDRLAAALDRMRP